MLFPLKSFVFLAAAFMALPPRPAGAEPSPSPEELARIVAGHNAFAWDLYREAGGKRDNLFFSPLSISLALAMTYAGAEGQTAREMAAVLHFGKDETLLHAASRELMAKLIDTEASSRLALANRLWPADGMRLKPEFLALAARYYGAEPQTLDFVAHTEDSRLAINHWVSDQTGKMIDDLLQEGDLTPQTLLVLTNAVYFQGSWARAFKPGRTRTIPFRLESGQSVDTQCMQQEGTFDFAETDEVKILQMPYADSDLAFLVLLPVRPDGLADLETRLEGAFLDRLLEQLRPQGVAVTLPRFELDSRTELQQVLQRLGMVEAFGGKADFSRMTDGAIHIDEVIHHGHIKVDEQGTTAAAATAVMMEKSMGLSFFRATHPFLFMIRDTATGSILFLGRLMNPVS